MSETAEATWAGLNPRQQTYLREVYDHDQLAENEVKARRARWERTPPAAEWRLITFSIAAPASLVGYTSVVERLRKAGHHDPGAGSTLAALERRGLVETVHDQVEILGFGYAARVRVRLTRIGRGVARAGTGTTAPTKTPTGLLSAWSLRALARLYAASEAGLSDDGRGADRAPGHTTLLALERHKAGPLYEPVPGGSILDDRRVRINAAGRRHYELHAACYHELYGAEVEGFVLPDPEPRDGAHADLAAHTARRARHLLRETDLRVLVVLVEDGRPCRYLRTGLVEDDYERWGEDPPADIAATPHGLLRWQVKDIARSEKPMERLAAYASGPLAKVVDVPNSRYHRAAAPTLPLLVLTEDGRRHYQEHRDEYRELYPEMKLPPVRESSPAERGEECPGASVEAPAPRRP
jgi:DNA-binding MarR family transcriptional regulator